MADSFIQVLSKRRNRSSTPSEGSIPSPEAKKRKQNFSPSPNTKEDETHSISSDLDMSQNLDGKLQAILEKLKKLDIIESTVKSIQANLTKLEARTQKLEPFQAHAKKEIEVLQERARFAEEHSN